ncbi:MAG TPA: acyl-CoA dehydrogenase family protein [Kofleriaceae bacterium]|jgi:alkylation response protein AidB-like acyl-CoA dehydrogenase|nr:acyl-CoA dehydrogenase family protein [Kofleriaceae bacterium]
MARPDPLLLDTARKLFRAVADPQTRRAGNDEAARRAAWQAIEDGGLTRAWLAESAGGADASLVDGFAILTAAGEVALDVPLAETLLAGWLLASAGMAVPDGKLAPIDRAGVEIRDGQLRGQANRVAFAREVDRLAVCGVRGSAGFVALVDRAACRVEPHDNLAGEPRDTVVFERVAPVALAAVPADTADWLHAMGAVARACQMAGALQAILARSVQYAGERVAFDRPIGKFQAIQHALARLAGEVAAALAASGSAADALATAVARAAPAVPAFGDDGDGTLLEVASAKIRCGEAAAAGAAIAHQVHGAIGFSTEHPLHRYTRRLWAWRDDHGSETAWAVRLGAHVAARGADALWPMLAAR